MGTEDRRLPYYLKFVRELGVGSFGRVVLATDTRIIDGRNKLVAVKLIERGERTVTKYVEREVLLHRSLWHKHIVGFREVRLTDSHLCIVLNYIGGGSVHDFVNAIGCLPEALARWIFQQLITAVDYCHGMTVMNRDIKLRHLLMDDCDGTYPVVRLCDFGFAKHGRHSMPKTPLGTEMYVAPEVLSCMHSTGRYDGGLADVWCCGMCLYFMLFGFGRKLMYRPIGAFESQSGSDCRRELVLPDSRPHLKTELPRISRECEEFLGKLLQIDPSQRVRISEIWEDPWFKKDLPQNAKEYNQSQLSNLDALNSHYNHLQSEDDVMRIIQMARQGGGGGSGGGAVAGGQGLGSMPRPRGKGSIGDR